MKSEFVIVSIILIVAAFLRMYKIGEYAIFLSDQAIDSTAVKNILDGDFTLLGPRASVGQFFNGPAIYYLMIPFFFLLKSDPLAGTYFQISLQLATIPIIFLLGRRIGTRSTGTLAAILFAASPLFIYYSKSAFNAYPALFLSTLAIYLLTYKTKRLWQFALGGLVTGVLVQAHYLLYVYAFFYFVYAALQKKIKYTLTFALSALVGLSPFILFELRHNFFNTNAILKHIVSGGGEGVILSERLFQFFTSVSQLLGYKDTFLGGTIILVTLFACILFIRNYKSIWNIYSLSFLSLLVSLSLYRGIIQSHYIIGFLPILVLMLAYFVTSVKLKRGYIFSLSLILVMSVLVNVNTQLKIPEEQDSFGLASQRKAVEIIKSEVAKMGENAKWNITQDLQRDNRAMPIRYMLSLDENMTQPLAVENYHENDHLIIVMNSNKKLLDVRTWEFVSFGKDYKILSSKVISKSTIIYTLGKRI